MADDVKKALTQVEKLVKALAGDVGQLKRTATSHDGRFDELQKLVEGIAEDRKETDAALREIARSQSSLASAVGQALAQLTLAQSLEKRVERLESLMLPKH